MDHEISLLELKGLANSLAYQGFFFVNHEQVSNWNLYEIFMNFKLRGIEALANYTFEKYEDYDNAQLVSEYPDRVIYIISLHDSMYHDPTGIHYSRSWLPGYYHDLEDRFIKQLALIHNESIPEIQIEEIVDIYHELNSWEWIQDSITLEAYIIAVFKRVFSIRLEPVNQILHIGEQFENFCQTHNFKIPKSFSDTLEIESCSAKEFDEYCLYWTHLLLSSIPFEGHSNVVVYQHGLLSIINEMISFWPVKDQEYKDHLQDIRQGKNSIRIFKSY